VTGNPEAGRGSERTPAKPPGRPFTTSDFDYHLPPHLVAHHPAAERDASRLLVVRRGSDTFQHRRFRDIVQLIPAGDILVLNETRVFPARLLGHRAGGGEAEVVLLHPYHARSAGTDHTDPHDGGDFGWSAEWTALVRPGAKLKPGRVIRVGEELEVEVVAILEDGVRHVRLHTPLPIRDAVYRFGHMPLPPYIDRADEAEDRERYQTVYGSREGSVAAPTAGLHFTPAVLDALRSKGVQIATVLLHVGVGTFRPVEVEDPTQHVMHEEWYEVLEEQAAAMNRVRSRGGKLWAVGTTVARTLESAVGREDAAASDGAVPDRIVPGAGWTRLYIRPGFRFAAVDHLITNFHLPRSTLLMLVTALAGHGRIMSAYAEAVREEYRFYSYGDAMVIL
jgi:S-adenosylmethionine:tRNA ribosyltransferase-isomerase